MLYRTLKRLIEKGQTEGLAEKIDIFFAADKLTEAEYNELAELLVDVYKRQNPGSGAAGTPLALSGNFKYKGDAVEGSWNESTKTFTPDEA